MHGSKKVFLVGIGLFALVLLFYTPDLLTGKWPRLGTIYDPSNVLEVLPWDILNLESFRRGEVPLWDSRSGLGTPHLGSMQTSFFFPLKLTFYILPYWLIYEIILIIKLSLAGLFAFLLGRELGLKTNACIIVALSFMFSGYFLLFFNMVTLNVEILIPLLLLSVERVIKKGALLYWMLLTAVLWMTLVGGHPTAAVHALMITIIYFLWRTFTPLGITPPFHRKGGVTVADGNLSHTSSLRDKSLTGFTPLNIKIRTGIKMIFCLVLSISLAFTMAMPQILPSAEFLRRSWAFYPPDIGTIHLNIKSFITAILPWFYGDSRWVMFNATPNFFLISPHEGLSTYANKLFPRDFPPMIAVSLVLMIYGLYRRKGRRMRTSFFIIYALFSLCIIFGLPPINYMTRLPILRDINNFKYIIPSFFLCTSVLAGWGYEALVRDERPIRVALLAIGTFCAIGGITLAVNLHPPAFPLDYQYITRRIIIISGLILFIPLFVVLFKIGLIHEKALGYSIAGLIMINLFFIKMGINPFYLIKPPDNGYLLKRMDKMMNWEIRSFLDIYNERVIAYSLPSFPSRKSRIIDISGVVPPNLLHLKGLNDIIIHNPLLPRHYFDMMCWLTGSSPSAMRRQYLDRFYLKVDERPLNKSLLNLMNIGYSIKLLPDMYNQGSLVVEKILDSPRLVHLFFQTRVANGPFEVIAWMSEAKVDLDRAMILEEPPPADFVNVNYPVRAASRPILYEPGRVTIKVISEEPGFLLLSGLYYPGWRAYLDGSETRIWKADHGLRSVFFPKGSHVVGFVYKPLSFRMGVIVALTGIFIGIFFFIMSRIKS